MMSLKGFFFLILFSKVTVFLTGANTGPPRANMGTGEGRVTRSLNISDVRSGGNFGQIFRCIHLL